MNKKAIAILGAIFVLIIGTLGFLIYSKSGNNSDTPTNQETENVEEIPGNNDPLNPTPNPEPVFEPSPVTGGQFYKLTDDQVVSPALTFNGSGVAYFTRQGFLYRSSFAKDSNQADVYPLQFGDKKQLAIDPKQNISKVIWPPNLSQDMMLEYQSGSKRTWEFFNNSTGAFTPLPVQVYSLSFLPSGNKIYYVWSSLSGNDTVNVSDPDTQNYQTLSEIWDKNALVYVSPDGFNVVYHKDPATVSGVENPIVLTDVEGKTWSKIVSTGFNSGVLWSPDGKKFLFGKKDQSLQKYKLWYYDLLGGEIRDLGYWSSPDKAVWSADSQTVYFAVAKSGSAESGGLTSDSFFRLNTVTGENREYDPGDRQFDGRDLFYDKDRNLLFFRNGQDGGLYYLDLN